MNRNQAELLHDLRMPLQLMYSCAQLLEAELQDHDGARGYVEMLMGSAKQMQRMLNAALEAERPDVQACFVRSDLVSRTWECFTRCQLYARRKKIRLTFHSNSDRLELALDEDKYVRILMNLISNALKFTPEGGSVQICVLALGDFAEVSVADDGCGIAPDRLEAVFELHETDGGFGYGLYIAREYARLLGGGIAVSSEEGAGSVFTVRLPVCSVEAMESGGMDSAPDAKVC